MLEDKLFVISAQRPWSGAVPGEAQWLAGEISRRNRVLYINPPLDPVALMLSGKQHLQGKGRALPREEFVLNRMNPNLWVFEAPLVLPLLDQVHSQVVFDMMNREGSQSYADTVKWALRELEVEEFYLLCDNDPARGVHLRELLAPRLTVFYRHHADVYGPPAHVRRLEAEMARRSDLVVAHGERFARELGRYNADTFDIGQGIPRDKRHWEICAERLYAVMVLLEADGVSDQGHSTLTEVIFS